MKRCPECRRDYYDETQLYCLDDGCALVEGPATRELTPTLIFSGEPPPWPSMSATAPMSGARRAVEPSKASIAVLPFAHLSKQDDDEYFCDGLAEELINALARIEYFKVVARTSSFSFKGKEIAIAQIGSILGVRNIVEGSVRKFGDRMRITVQLVDALDGFHIWSDKYDTEVRDLFDVQDEITRSVVAAVRSKLVDESNDSDQMAQPIGEFVHHANDVGAYQEYLRGRFYFNKFTPADFERAIECFTRAIEIDPGLSAAYAGLAEAHIFTTEFGLVPPREGMPRAKEAALKALTLDAGSADAYTALGTVMCEFEYDFEGSEREFLKALKIVPNNTRTMAYYGGLLSQLGRFDEGDALFARIAELSPLSAADQWIYPYSLLFQRRYDECIERARRLLELESDFAAAHLVLSFAYQAKEEYEECVAEYARFLELCGLQEPAAVADASFETGGWEGFLKAMTEKETRAAVSFYIAGVFFTARGEPERAMNCFEDSYERREGHLAMFKVDPRLDPLRDHKRYKKLLNRIGFPS